MSRCDFLHQLCPIPDSSPYKLLLYFRPFDSSANKYKINTCAALKDIQIFLWNTLYHCHYIRRIKPISTYETFFKRLIGGDQELPVAKTTLSRGGIWEDKISSIYQWRAYAVIVYGQKQHSPGQDIWYLVTYQQWVCEVIWHEEKQGFKVMGTIASQLKALSQNTPQSSIIV